MDIQEYFEKHTGSGILATADADGKVDAAVYARRHLENNATLAFSMCDRLSHHNLRSNPHAASIFLGKGQGYSGKRLYLTRMSEYIDPERIAALHRRTTPDSRPDQRKFLVAFSLDRFRPALGPENEV